MDEQGFRLFLKRAGKQAHVIDELVEGVQFFQAYLAAAGRGDLESAAEQNLVDYTTGMPGRAIKIRMRGIALYYKFLGKTSLSRLAHELREQQTAITRQAFDCAIFAAWTRSISPGWMLLG